MAGENASRKPQESVRLQGMLGGTCEDLRAKNLVVSPAL